jgi:hypothetical protein
MKNFAAFLLVVLVAVAMGFIDLARAIDVDWVLAKKTNRTLNSLLMGDVTQEQLLKVGDLLHRALLHSRLQKQADGR